MDFTQKIKSQINDSIELRKKIAEEKIDAIIRNAETMSNVLLEGGKIMLCGNGGSAADSQHIAAELVVRLRGDVNRKALPALALTVDTSILTAGGNDYGFDTIFSRQVEAYGERGDCLIGISTSGNSANVIKAVETANNMGIKTIGLLGGEGGKLADVCSDAVIIPTDITARIQEVHIMVGHMWCEIIEEILFRDMF